jgi:hypothetical protein
MKNILLLLIILFASCKKEDSNPSPQPEPHGLHGYVSFTVDRIKLPTQVANISIDNIPAGAIIGNDTLKVKTKDTLVHTYKVILYDQVLPFDTFYSTFKAEDHKTVNVVITR